MLRKVGWLVAVLVVAAFPLWFLYGPVGSPEVDFDDILIDTDKDNILLTRGNRPIEARSFLLSVTIEMEDGKTIERSGHFERRWMQGETIRIAHGVDESHITGVVVTGKCKMTWRDHERGVSASRRWVNIRGVRHPVR